jgi:hypothetical protein
MSFDSHQLDVDRVRLGGEVTQFHMVCHGYPGSWSASSHQTAEYCLLDAERFPEATD